jgi:hypothetical protein
MNSTQSFFYEEKLAKKFFFIHFFLFLLLVTTTGVVSFYLITKQDYHITCVCDVILICVNRSPLSKGETFTEDHLSFSRIPFREKLKPSYFWKDRETILGKIALVDLPTNTPLTSAHFTQYPALRLTLTEGNRLNDENIFSGLQESKLLKRKRTTLLLGQIGVFTKQAIPLLLEHTKNPDIEIQKAAQHALQEIWGTSLKRFPLSENNFSTFPSSKEGYIHFERILKTFKIKKGNLHQNIWILGQLGVLKKKALSRLFTLLNDPEGEIREAAQNALKQIL